MVQGLGEVALYKEAAALELGCSGEEWKHSAQSPSPVICFSALCPASSPTGRAQKTPEGGTTQASLKGWGFFSSASAARVTQRSHKRVPHPTAPTSLSRQCSLLRKVQKPTMKPVSVLPFTKLNRAHSLSSAPFISRIPEQTIHCTAWSFATVQ